MPINHMLPFFSTAIMLVFAVSVLKRYEARRNRAYLFWGIGLIFFGAGSFAEAYLALAWSPVVFVIWYLFGAALNAAWLGHGTLNLLVKKPWVNGVTVLLIVGSFIAAGLMLTTSLDASQFTTDAAISEQFADIMEAGAPVRYSTPFFNIYGLFTLVGGAIYSAYLYWRKRVLPHRVVGNLLIAVGALTIGVASAMARVGNGEYLYAAELVAAILMYSGFMFPAFGRARVAQMAGAD
jgi:hypothetical protein